MGPAAMLSSSRPATFICEAVVWQRLHETFGWESACQVEDRVTRELVLTWCRSLDAVFKMSWC